MSGALHQGDGLKARFGPGAALWTVAGVMALAGCAGLMEDEPQEPEQPRMGSAIVAVSVRGGSCDAPAVEGHGLVYVKEPFAVTVEVQAAAPSLSRVIRVATGVDSQGARDRIVTFDGAELGSFVACLDGFELDWPARAQLRVELVEAARGQQVVEGEFPVLPRDHVDTVVFPRDGHPTRRRGVPVRRGEFLRLDASVYVANGTDLPQTLDSVVSGIVHDGQKAQSWAIRLDRPITVAPRSISEVHDFHLSYPLNSGLGQRLYNDRLNMLVSGIKGGAPSPGLELRTIEWGLMAGIAVDVVFVGDFTPEKRTRATSLIIEGASGYLEGAGVTLNRSLSRGLVAAEVGLPAPMIASLRSIEDRGEASLLAAYQPRKSIERLTVYVVESLWQGDGYAGEFRGGYAHSTDPKTPFRSPVLVMPTDLGPGGFHSGAAAFSRRAARVIAAAIGELEEVESSACDDINPFLPENTFNLMSAVDATYGWVLSPCQRSLLVRHPALYVY